MKKKFMKIIAMALTLASLFTFAAPALADRGEIVDGWGEDFETIEYDPSTQTILKPESDPTALYEVEEYIPNAKKPSIVTGSSSEPLYLISPSIPNEVSDYAKYQFQDMLQGYCEVMDINISDINRIKLEPGFQPYGYTDSKIFYFPLSIDGIYISMLVIVKEPNLEEGFSASMQYSQISENLNSLRGRTTADNPVYLLATEDGVAAISKGTRQAQSMEFYCDPGEEPVSQEYLERTALTVSETDAARDAMSDTDSVMITLNFEDAIGYQVPSRETAETNTVKKRFTVPGYSNGSYSATVNGVTRTKGMCWAATGMMLYSARTTNQGAIEFSTWKECAETYTTRKVGFDKFSTVQVAAILTGVNRSTTAYKYHKQATNSVAALNNRPVR